MEDTNGPKPQHPLVATRDRLQRRLAEAQGAFDSLADASAKEIGELRQQVEGLLAAVEAMRSAASETASWKPEADLYKLADQVRKELGEG